MSKFKYIVCILMSNGGCVSAQLVPQKYVNYFKQLKQSDSDKTFYTFVRKVKKAGIAPGECVEEFVEQKKKKALAAIYGKHELEQLNNEQQYIKRIYGQWLSIINYKDDVPTYLRKMIKQVVNEMDVRGTINVEMIWGEGTCSSIMKRFKRIDSANIEDYLFKDNFYLYLNSVINFRGWCAECVVSQSSRCSCKKMGLATLRHEFEHIKKNHGSVEMYHHLINNNRKSFCLKPIEITEKQSNKLSRSVETEADLMPLAYASLLTAQDHEEAAKMFGESDREKHSSSAKRLKRATVIRKIKEAECRYNNPLGYAFFKFASYIQHVYYTAYALAGMIVMDKIISYYVKKSSDELFEKLLREVRRVQ